MLIFDIQSYTPKQTPPILQADFCKLHFPVLSWQLQEWCQYIHAKKSNHKNKNLKKKGIANENLTETDEYK